MLRKVRPSRCAKDLIRLLVGSLIAGLILFGQAHNIAAGAPKVHRLTGSVTDPQGQPLSGATVCPSDGKTELKDQTDALGQYGFTIDSGNWKLSVHMEHYVSPPAEALTLTDANTDTEKILALKPRARLVSDLLLESGEEDLPVTRANHTPAIAGKPALEGLEIIGPDPPAASNRSQVTFQCAAHDTSGKKITISPQWRLEPPVAGATSCSRNGEVLTFEPHLDFIGQVKVFLTDSISGQTAQFNISDSLAECDQGLAVFHRLSGDAPEVSIGDRQGFQLTIPQGAIPQGDSTLIFLRKPRVLDVKRITPGYQVWGQIYDVRACDDLSFFSSHDVSFVRPLEMILPLVPEARPLGAVIGWWSYHDLEWSSLGGTASAEEISVEVEHLSQFAVLSALQPLAVRDIQLLPNPFTPHDPEGLQLGFTLSTNRARKPFVTIKIYSLTGDLVRTLCENEPLSKGSYVPGESYSDSRGGDITRWDGRTDSGELARNGRYVIHFQAIDSGGTAEVLETVVLIK